MKRIGSALVVMMAILGITVLAFAPRPPTEGFTAATAPFRQRYSTHGISVDGKKKTITDGNKTLYYAQSFNSREGRANCHDKLRTCEVLAAAGLPVARHYSWDHGADNDFNLREVKEKVGYPLVLKPRSNHKGYNVFVGIEDPDELLEKVKRLGTQKVIIEKEMKGDEYRVNVLGGEVIAITKRSQPYVIGDGQSSIKELVRRSSSNRYDTIRTADQSLLRRHGMSVNTVPRKGQRVVVSKVANYRNGAKLEYVPVNTVNPENIQMFEQVADVMRVANTGFDYIVSAPLSVPYRHARTAAVIDVNGRPGWYGAPYDAIPTSQMKQRLVDKVLSILFKGEKIDRYVESS